MTVARYFSQQLRKRILAGEIPAWLGRHPRKSYIIAANLSSVSWADKVQLRELREKAKQLTASTGVMHVLDHIIPLQHPYVCGLSVPENIRIVPYAVNAAKSNRWMPDQLEMFDKPEQLWLSMAC